MARFHGAPSSKGQQVLTSMVGRYSDVPGTPPVPPQPPLFICALVLPSLFICSGALCVHLQAAPLALDVPREHRARPRCHDHRCGARRAAEGAAGGARPRGRASIVEALRACSLTMSSRAQAVPIRRDDARPRGAPTSRPTGGPSRRVRGRQRGPPGARAACSRGASAARSRRATQRAVAWPPRGDSGGARCDATACLRFGAVGRSAGDAGRQRRRRAARLALLH